MGMRTCLGVVNAVQIIGEMADATMTTNES
jgi:hypothetical protein